jgi:putative tricarboxylic transport membrane protein
VVAAAAAAFAIIAFAGTYTFDEVPASLMEGLGAAEFPRLIAGVILLLSIILALQPARPGAETPSPMIPCAWWTLAACGVFVGVLHLSGMLAAMLLFVLVVGWIWGERRPAVLLGSALGLVLCIYLIFVRLFGLSLPRGMLGDALFI